MNPTHYKQNKLEAAPARWMARRQRPPPARPPSGRADLDGQRRRPCAARRMPALEPIDGTAQADSDQPVMSSSMSGQ